MSEDREAPTDELVMDLIRRHFNEDFRPHLTCPRWKDGIDIDGPTFAIQHFARGIWQAAQRPALTFQERMEVECEENRAACGVSSSPARVRVLLAIIRRLTGTPS